MKPIDCTIRGVTICLAKWNNITSKNILASKGNIHAELLEVL